MSDYLDLIGKLVQGSMESSMRNREQQQAIQATEDRDILADSLKTDYAEKVDNLQSASDARNMRLADTLAMNQAQLQHNFDMEKQKYKTSMDLIMPATQHALNIVGSDLQDMGARKEGIAQKVKQMNTDRQVAEDADLGLTHIEKKLREFFDEERGFLNAGLNESDIIKSYENAKTNEKYKLTDAINIATKLPPGHKKREDVTKLINRMLKKLGVTYNAQGERQISDQDMYDEFTDGDLGYRLLGGVDATGNVAKGIIRELEGYREQLGKGDEYRDEYYGISPEDRLFYDTYNARSKSKKQEGSDLIMRTINEMLERTE